MSFLDPWTAPNGITYKLASSVSDKALAQQFIEANPHVPDGEIGCPENVSGLTLQILETEDPVYITAEDGQGLCAVVALHIKPEYRKDQDAIMVIVASDSRVYGTDVYEWLVKASVRFLDWGANNKLLVTVKYDFTDMANEIFGAGNFAQSTLETPYGDFYCHWVTVTDQAVQNWRAA